MTDSRCLRVLKEYYLPKKGRKLFYITTYVDKFVCRAFVISLNYYQSANLILKLNLVCFRIGQTAFFNHDIIIKNLTKLLAIKNVRIF